MSAGHGNGGLEIRFYIGEEFRWRWEGGGVNCFFVKMTRGDLAREICKPCCGS